MVHIYNCLWIENYNNIIKIDLRVIIIVNVMFFYYHYNDIKLVIYVNFYNFYK